MKNGVYQVRNLKNSKRYIGSAASSGGFKDRCKDNQKFLKANKHHSPILQNAWIKYSGEAFVFEILLCCDPEDCLMYEQIAFDCYKPEYNICKIAGSCLGVKRSQATRNRIRDINVGLHQGEDNISSKIYESTVLSILDDMKSGMRSPSISQKYNLSRTQIKAIMSGKSWSHILVSNEIERLRQSNSKEPNLGSRNGRSKLIEQDVLHIKLMLKNTTVKNIATTFGVSVSCIKNIKYGYRWSHL